MDREAAIRVQTALLLGVLAEIVAILPGDGEALVRRVRLAVLAMLRPAESAARRVIAIAATLVTVVPSVTPQAMPVGGIPTCRGAGMPVFALFDPRRVIGPRTRWVRRQEPRIRSLEEPFEPSPPVPPDALPNDLVDNAGILRRIVALRAALEDVPKQGRRLARHLAGGRTRYRRVMRPGRPPGFRERGRRAVNVILADCQSLALMVLHEVEIADSS